MNLVTFTTSAYNHCSTMQNLLKDKHEITNIIRKIFCDYFGLNDCVKYKKYGMFVTFDIEYDSTTLNVENINISTIQLYLCNFKLGVKRTNDEEALINSINNPIIEISDEIEIKNIQEFLFLRTDIAEYITGQIKLEKYKHQFERR